MKEGTQGYTALFLLSPNSKNGGSYGLWRFCQLLPACSFGGNGKVNPYTLFVQPSPGASPWFLTKTTPPDRMEALV
jgi:hypothetical protein